METTIYLTITAFFIIIYALAAIKRARVSKRRSLSAKAVWERRKKYEGVVWIGQL